MSSAAIRESDLSHQEGISQHLVQNKSKYGPRTFIHESRDRLNLINLFEEATKEDVNNFCNLISDLDQGRIVKFKKLYKAAPKVYKIVDELFTAAHCRDFSYLLGLRLTNLNVEKINFVSEFENVKGNFLFEFDGVEKKFEKLSADQRNKVENDYKKLSLCLKKVAKVYQRAVNFDNRCETISQYIDKSDLLLTSEGRERDFKQLGLVDNFIDRQEVENFVGLIRDFSKYKDAGKAREALLKIGGSANYLYRYFRGVADYSYNLYFGAFEIDLEKAKTVAGNLSFDAINEPIFEGMRDDFNAVIKCYKLSRSIVHSLNQAAKSELQFEVIDSSISNSREYHDLMILRDSVEKDEEIDMDLCRALSEYFSGTSLDLTSILLFSNIMDLRILADRIKKFQGDSEPLKNIRAHLTRFNMIANACSQITEQAIDNDEDLQVEGDVDDFRAKSKSEKYLKPLNTQDQKVLNQFNQTLDKLAEGDIDLNKVREAIVSFNDLLHSIAKESRKRNFPFHDFSWILYINTHITLDMEKVKSAIENLRQHDENLAKELIEVSKFYEKLERVVLAYYSKMHVFQNKDVDDHKDE